MQTYKPLKILLYSAYSLCSFCEASGFPVLLPKEVIKAVSIDANKPIVLWRSEKTANSLILQDMKVDFAYQVFDSLGKALAFIEKHVERDDIESAVLYFNQSAFFAYSCTNSDACIYRITYRHSEPDFPTNEVYEFDAWQDMSDVILQDAERVGILL